MLRLIRFILISVLFLFLIATGVSLLIPTHIRISKAINMHASRDSILPLIKDTSNWKQWYPPFMISDSAPKFSAVNVTVQKENDSEVVMQLQQGNKIPVVNGWTVFSSADSTTLQWYMDFHLKWYPWQKFGSLFYESTYGFIMQQGLENIKNIVQKNQ